MSRLKRGPGDHLTDEERRQAIADYWRGLSYAEIGKRYRISGQPTFARIAKARGRRIKPPPAYDATIVMLREQRLTYRRIAAAVGVSQATVYNALLRAGREDLMCGFPAKREVRKVVSND